MGVLTLLTLRLTLRSSVLTLLTLSLTLPLLNDLVE